MKRTILHFLFIIFAINCFSADKETVNVQAGQLSKTIKSSKKYKIEYLEIIGTLNGDDILFLREMMGTDRLGNATGKGRLAFLDLSKAQIVKGGGSYFRFNKEAKDYYTTNGIIGEAMFEECPQLQAIVLPNNITEIRLGAFYGCKNLMRVFLPETLEEIGESAFWDCVKLDKVEIPDKQKIKIGKNAFRNSGLRKIVLPPNVFSIENQAFFACTSLDSVIVDAITTNIPICFCYGCENLTYVELPNCIYSIGEGAFQKCKNLKTINIPKELNTIGKGVFYECASLEEVYFPKNVKEFGEGMFYMATSLRKVRLPASIKTIPAETFAGCKSLEWINIPRDCQLIDEYAFFECKQLQVIRVESNTIPKMASHAFSNSRTLSMVFVPKGTLQAYKSDENWGFFPQLTESTTLTVEGFVADPLLEKAKKGDKESQFQLGRNLLTGENGYSQKPKEGFAWTLKAAQQNHVRAQALTGFCYHQGRGTSVDYKKAVFWYTKAANAGDGQSQHNLGVLYINGWGVPKSKEKGIYWKKKAAAQGIESAILDLRDLGIYNYK